MINLPRRRYFINLKTAHYYINFIASNLLPDSDFEVAKDFFIIKTKISVYCFDTDSIMKLYQENFYYFHKNYSNGF